MMVKATFVINSFVGEYSRHQRWLEDSNTTISNSTNGSDEDDDEDEFVGPDHVQILRDTFVVYGSVLLIMFVMFCVVRRRYQRPYNLRHWVDKIRSPLAADQYGFISWMWELRKISDEDFLEHCGMDAMCFLRACKMGFRFAVLGCMNALWLIPLYMTAESGGSKQDIHERILEANIGIVPSGSSHLVGCALASYVMFGFFMYLISAELQWFREQRHNFLRKPRARNYALYVRNIPPDLRTNAALTQHFNRCFPSDTPVVCEARVALKAPHLAVAVKNRDAIVAELENEIAIEDATGMTPTQYSGEESAVLSSAEDLKEANQDVSQRIQALEKMQQGSGERPAETNFSESVISEDDAEILSAAFVSFTSLEAANGARQRLHHPDPFVMEVFEAPEPDDVFWANVGLSHKQLQVGSLISSTATTVLCLLWTIPMSFFASLSSVEALRDELEFVDDLIDIAPFMEPVLQLLAPFLVVIFNATLPIILRILSMREGPVSGAVVEASVFVKLAAFTIIQTFFISSISGALTKELANIVDDPTNVVDILAEALPDQFSYMLQITFVGMALMVGLEILRVVPCILAYLRRFFGPKLTEKQRETTYFGLRPFSDPADLSYSTVTAQVVLFFMVAFVYQVLAPFSAFVITFCFAFTGASFRHQFVYIYGRTPDSGGKIWIGLIKILCLCMLVAEITVVAVLALKKATYATPLMFPLIIATYMFNGYIRQQHFKVTDVLPSRHSSEQDRDNRSLELSFLKNAFLQPEMRVKEAFPEPLSVARAQQLQLHPTKHPIPK